MSSHYTIRVAKHGIQFSINKDYQLNILERDQNGHQKSNSIHQISMNSHNL